MVYLASKLGNKLTSRGQFQTHSGFHSRYSGFSLLEVLLSLLIFTVGFLGLASLQHVAIKLTHDAVLQNSAASLAESLLTQVRVEGHSSNISRWQARVNDALPEGKGRLVKQADGFIITLQWQGSEHSTKVSIPQEYQLTFK